MDDVLNDRYELGEMLGSGGMGEVYRARDRRLDRTVAVKLLRHGPLADDTARARMRSEALLAASIHHPGVAQVFDYEEAADTQAGTSFIVMEFVEGHSLAELLREGGTMPPEQVMSVVEQVAEGLAAAHAAGIVHRDLKPANIMLTPAGRTVLVDFGIARAEGSEPLTETGTLLGTAQYSSPEQTTGHAATAQSDLYSLGVVARHCLTGTSPFRRDTPLATAMAHLQDDPPPLGADVPPGVRDLLDRLVAKNPSERPADAAAVAALARGIGADATIDLPETLRTPAVGADDTRTRAIPVAAALTSGAVADPDRRRPRRLLAVVAAAVVLLLALGGWAMWPGDAATVPDVTGLDVDTASQTVRDAGMDPRVETVDSPGADAGEVLEQSPEAGDDPADDGIVTLSVASGQVTIPDGLLGRPYDEVAAALTDLGLEVERADVATSDATAGDVVSLGQTGRVDIGSTVTVQVATTPTPAPTTAAPTTQAPETPAGPGDDKGKGKTEDKPGGKGKDEDKKGP